MPTRAHSRTDSNGRLPTPTGGLSRAVRYPLPPNEETLSSRPRFAARPSLWFEAAPTRRTRHSQAGRSGRFATRIKTAHAAHRCSIRERVVGPTAHGAPAAPLIRPFAGQSGSPAVGTVPTVSRIAQAMDYDRRGAVLSAPYSQRCDSCGSRAFVGNSGRSFVARRAPAAPCVVT